MLFQLANKLKYIIEQERRDVVIVFSFSRRHDGPVKSFSSFCMD